MKEGNEMVRHRSIARPNFRGFDPFVLGKGWVDGEMLILHNAFGRHGKWPGHAINHGRPGKRPPRHEWRKRRQIGSFSLGTTVLDPRADEPLFVIGQTEVVNE